MIFFEQEAFDKASKLRQDKTHSLNKVGHALHDLDPVFERFSRQPSLDEIACELGLRAPLLLQSMVIFKPPCIGSEVVWHHDATFLHTHPSRLLGMWFALTNATHDNGCLWSLPGGPHLSLCLHQREVSRWKQSTRRLGRMRNSCP